MSAGFFGRYEHSLDAKGRVILPAKFRVAFEHGGYLSQFFEGCLALYTPDEFEKQMRRIQAEAETGRDARNIARAWAAGTQDVVVDTQGRLPLPSFMRDYAGLESDVLVHGSIDRIELWSPTVWADKLREANSTLRADDMERK